MLICSRFGLSRYVRLVCKFSCLTYLFYWSIGQIYWYLGLVYWFDIAVVYSLFSRFGEYGLIWVWFLPVGPHCSRTDT